MNEEEVGRKNCYFCNQPHSAHRNTLHRFTTLSTREFLLSLAKSVGILCRYCQVGYYPCDCRKQQSNS